MTEGKLEKVRNVLKDRELDFLGFEGNAIYFKDECGYKYSTHVDRVVGNKFTMSHKYGKKNPFRFENMEVSLNKRNPYGSGIIYESYSGSIRDKMKFICGNCGQVFELLAHSFFDSDYRVCGDCYHSVQNTKLLDISEVREEVESFGFIPMFEEYKGVNQNMKVMDKDGYLGEICLASIRRGSQISKFAKYNKYAIQNVRQYCKNNETELTIPDQELIPYRENKGSWIDVICKCGERFTIDVHRIADGQTRCSKCSGSQSSLENKVESHLRDINIQYKTQHRFKDCKKTAMLPFDFYIQDVGLIEADGEGHYKIVKFNGIDKERARVVYEKTKINDEIKNKYCKDNHIKLLRIPYWEFEDDTYKTKINQWLGVAN